eukprot:534685-Pleurochrysis_carterae.AAC.1
MLRLYHNNAVNSPPSSRASAAATAARGAWRHQLLSGGTVHCSWSPLLPRRSAAPTGAALPA